MFKIGKSRGKFTVELYSMYNKLLWSAGGFSSKQAAIKNIRATIHAIGVKTVLVQDNSLQEPIVLKVGLDSIIHTNKKLWK